MRRCLTLLGVCLALLTGSLVAIAPAASASNTSFVSDDCDTGGVNLNDGLIGGTYVKVKTKPVGTLVQVCYRIDRDADPVIHEGGKLTFGTSSPPVQDAQAGYCSTRPNNTIDVDATVGPDRAPTFVHRLSPPYNLEELGICIRVGTFLFRASSVVQPDAENKLERDLVACSQVVGRVTDRQGAPLSDVVVHQIGSGVDQCASSALTSPTGQYSLFARVAVPTQTVLLRSERTGYQSQEVSVPVGDPTNTLADFSLYLDVSNWTSAGCEEDGNPFLASTLCKPLAEAGIDPTAPFGSLCEDAMQCDKTLAELATALSPDHLSVLAAMDARLTAEALVRDPLSLGASAPRGMSVEASEPTPQKWGQMLFYLVRDDPGTENCTDPSAVVHNGRCGFLAYIWESVRNGQPVHYYTIYGARSASNVPSQDCIENVGPINYSAVPGHDSGFADYKVGYRMGTYQGFRPIDESHAPNSGNWTMFKPGQFDLDPWTVKCPNVQRGAFQLHGGVNASGFSNHDYWTTPTHGCVRLTPGAVDAVHRRWDAAPNKRSFQLTVSYSAG